MALRTDLAYDLEDAESVVAEWATTREQLGWRSREAGGLLGIDIAMDLDRAWHTLNIRQKSLVRDMAKQAERLGRLADDPAHVPDPLAVVKLARFEDPKVQAAAGDQARKIRVIQTLAVTLSGRRRRQPVRIPATELLARRAKPCPRCGEQVHEGEWVYWDRDVGNVWHAEPCEQEAA